ncbi:MAG: glucosylceramidase [Saprospiraceae bacterium]|nr:glucosylceramidase [Saprospiraceae bacterium]
MSYIKHIKSAIRVFIILGILWFILFTGACNKNGNEISPPNTTTLTNDVDSWITTSNQSALLQKQNGILAFTETPNNYPIVDVDPSKSYQTIDGFGYTLTGGSAMLLRKMSSSARENILQELFGCTGDNACISYLRLSMGASDLDETVFSYNDLANDTEDLTLNKFSLSKDTLYLIPLLKEILKIQPDLKIMSSPWSPPIWMKSNKNSIGGQLLPKYYDVYASYFIKYILAMKSHGISIDAVTIQNEPQHGGNNPSLVMSASEQADFIKNHLGPKFSSAGIASKIIIWDHNCDKPEYPISILNDSGAKSYVNGSAFHLYAGDISAMSKVQEAHPDKNLYFTEQWTGANGNFEGDLQWHIKNVIIGSMRNYSKNALEWNLANDPSYKPHTPGGCSLCKGALTIDGNIATKNVSFYIIAHASRFVPTGSKRIYSGEGANIHQVAFLTPQGKIVMIALNESAQSEIFNILYKGKKAVVSMHPHSVTTFVW